MGSIESGHHLSYMQPAVSLLSVSSSLGLSLRHAGRVVDLPDALSLSFAVCMRVRKYSLTLALMSKRADELIALSLEP